MSRGRRPDGRPRYEATVYIGWNQPTSKYGIVWLDDFGGLSTQSVGLAPKMATGCRSSSPTRTAASRGRR
ncbi:hypothetical protein AB5I41_14030 [Sphingomonas sp. MMS24-JH45]